MSEKVDFKKVYKQLYGPPKAGFQVVEVPKMNFLMVDGVGNPNSAPAYQQAAEALYSLSYAIKFALKKQGLDYLVPPLEGLWWVDDMNEFSLANKDAWQWTMMIMQPDSVTETLVEKARQALKEKKQLPSLGNVRFESYTEGLSVQILYTGAYEDEAPTIAEMHKFLKNQKYLANGKHHEVYLSDPRKTPTEKLKTILRQPVRCA
jgi:hypothetical protein